VIRSAYEKYIKLISPVIELLDDLGEGLWMMKGDNG